MQILDQFFIHFLLKHFINKNIIDMYIHVYRKYIHKNIPTRWFFMDARYNLLIWELCVGHTLNKVLQFLAPKIKIRVVA